MIRPLGTGPARRGAGVLWHDGVMSEPFVIDVWSDVVCPFCYLGAHQLSESLAAFEHRADVVIRQRAFELDPNAPPDFGFNVDELFAHKYAMPLERARSLNEKLESDAAALGMTWSMLDARPSNTFDAHRLAKLAASQDLGRAMVERLFLAYFSQGVLLSDVDALSALARDVGVDAVDELWRGDDYALEVREDEALAQELGISGVPTLLLDEKFMVVGAQGAAQMLDVLRRAWARREDLVV
jgi:predicted DsbA family dithiol-disulfide isomerase